MLFGCGSNDGKQDGIQNNLIVSDSVNDEKVTVEEFMNHYQLTEADLEGIDLQANIDYYIVLKNEMGNEPKEEVVSTLKIEQKEMEEENAEKKEREKSNLSYLVEADEFIGDIPDFDNLKYVTYYFDYSDDMEIVSGLVDFQSSKLFLGSLEPVYEYYEGADEAYELTEEEILEIIQAIKETQFQSWDYNTIGNEDYFYEWKFGMEFNDGTVISYKGKQSEPIFYKGILDVIVNCQIK